MPGFPGFYASRMAGLFSSPLSPPSPPELPAFDAFDALGAGFAALFAEPVEAFCPTKEDRYDLSWSLDGSIARPDSQAESASCSWFDFMYEATRRMCAFM